MDYLHVQADNPWYNYYLFIGEKGAFGTCAQRMWTQPCFSVLNCIWTCPAAFINHANNIIGPKAKNVSLGGVADNKGADQPAHLHCLISAFVIRVLERVIYKLATGERGCPVKA